MVSFRHEQSVILQPNTVGQFCRQLFAGHLVGSWPMKRRTNFASNDNVIYFI